MRVLRPAKVGINIGWRFCIGAFVLSAAWGVGSAIGVGAGCEGRSVLFVNSSLECPEQIITALDVITDVLPSLIPAALVIPLNMPLGDKLQVCVAFGFRLIVIPFSVLHLSSIADFVQSTDPPLESTAALTMQQIMLFSSLLTSTIPNMKGFMSSFSMGMGVKLFESEAKTNPSQQSYALQTIGGSSTIKPPRKSGYVSRVRPAKSRTDVHILPTDGSAYEMGRADSDSQANADGGSNASRRGSQERIIGKTGS
ncbi:hypothetical protein INS49_007438 [Diaporthe citri]|uniref:uncharacterized protein n=1 Tax=Diaporthe citri TaxID=83186 RepID=UPI001C7EA1A1|nr:uncharacterized protein INS49_007438 [Diaporthe citri]KAG6353358.1 hypothetical protein INS49_007438 [Diaporthe citri]